MSSERENLRAIRLAVGGREALVWRNETGATVPVRLSELQAALKDPTLLYKIIARGVLNYGLCKGSSDLILCRRGDGRFGAIEVKAAGGRRSEEQERFIELVQSFGGLAGFAETVEEARRIIA